MRRYERASTLHHLEPPRRGLGQALRRHGRRDRAARSAAAPRARPHVRPAQLAHTAQRRARRLRSVISSMARRAPAQSGTISAVGAIVVSPENTTCSLRSERVTTLPPEGPPLWPGLRRPRLAGFEVSTEALRGARHTMKSSKERVKSHFNGRVTEWAGWYSHTESRTLEAQNLLSRQRLALEMVEAAGRLPSKILDVGCGTGEMAAKLMGRGYTVWGLDISEAMISHARDRWGSDRFQVGDTEHIPFGNNMFDAVVCLGVIEYQDTDEQTLREIWRVLKPGGWAVISTPSAVCPLYHMDRAVVSLEAVVRPLHYLVKYRLRGRGAHLHQASSEVVTRRYYRRTWLRQLRSAGLEPEEWICHGWGWYRSRLGDLALFLSRKGGIFRRGLERFFGRAPVCRASDRFVRNRALNWLASEQLVRLRAVK